MIERPTGRRRLGLSMLPMALLPIICLAASPALACNDENKLTDFMEEWLASSDETRAAVVDELDADLKKGGFHIEGLKAKYVTFFGKRSAPIGELKTCADDKIIDALDTAIKRTN